MSQPPVQSNVTVDPDSATIPGMLRLELARRATINESPQLTRLVGEAEREKGPVEIDCSKTETWGPFGVALLASCIAVRRKGERETHLIRPAEDEAAALFEETGLERILSGEGAVSNGGQVHAIPIEQHPPTSKVAAELSEPLSAADPAAPALVQPCLETMLDNLFEWSQSQVGGFVVVRWSKKGRQARFALVDRGLGIPAVLRRRQVGNLIRANDSEVIEAAFSDPLVTSRREGNEGVGLMHLREYVLSHKGKLTVISLGAKISWSADRITKAASPAMRGTAIEVEIGT